MQASDNKGQFRIGPLRSLNQVITALGKTIRAMADGTISTADGARIANGLGIMRACLETQQLELINRRLAALEDPLADPHQLPATAAEVGATLQ